MLTALSVAREIGMIPQKEKIILVQGYPHVDKAEAYLEFVYTEKSSKEMSGFRSASVEVFNIFMVEKNNVWKARIPYNYYVIKSPVLMFI